MPLGIALVDYATGRFTGANPAFCRIAGRGRDELCRMDFPSITHPEDVAPSMENTRRLYAGEIPELRMEKRYLRPDGSVVWVSLRVVPLWERDGHPAFNLVMAEDITERKRTEASLREAVRFNQQVLDSVRDGVLVTGPDLRYRVFNRFMERITGMAAKDVLGRHPAEVFPFLTEAGIIRTFEQVLEGELPEPLEFRYSVPGSGRSGWVSNLSAPLRNEAGEIVGVIATVRETTERKLAEEQLRVSEARFRAVIENSHDGITFTDADGVVLYRSPSCDLINGFADQESVGRNGFERGTSGRPGGGPKRLGGSARPAGGGLAAPIPAPAQGWELDMG